MSQQNARSLRVVFVETTSVPDTNASVVASGEKQMRRLVDEADAVHVGNLTVVSNRNPQRTLVELSIENVHAGVGSTRDDFLAVVGKCERKRSESVDVCVQAQTSDVFVGPV